MEYLDEFVIYHLTARIKILKQNAPDKLYLAKELCIDFWEDFDGYHIVIGKLIKILSDNNELPLKPVGRTSCNKQLYRLM